MRRGGAEVAEQDAETRIGHNCGTDEHRSSSQRIFFHQNLCSICGFNRF
jgi:hypothetical protein